MGMEASGTVGAVGAGVDGFRPGDEVCALIAGGAYAEYVVVPAAQLLPIPDGLSLVDAAALPEVASTVWSTIVMDAGLKAGETLLVHGGGSGIGTHAIQVGKALGATVAVTVGSEAKAHRCRELGADIVINYREQNFATELAGQVDVILDIMGGQYVPGNVDALAIGGRLVIIGMQGGLTGELNVGALIGKRARVIGLNVRNRPLTGPGSKAEIVAAVAEKEWPLVTQGSCGRSSRPSCHWPTPNADRRCSIRRTRSARCYCFPPNPDPHELVPSTAGCTDHRRHRTSREERRQEPSRLAQNLLVEPKQVAPTMGPCPTVIRIPAVHPAAPEPATGE